MLEADKNLCWEALSDKELVERYNAGAQEAFRQLAARYYIIVRKRASEFQGLGIETDDLFQEGMLGLHNAVCTYNSHKGASFSTYAGVCIRNRLISALRACNAEKNRINKEHFPIEDAEYLPSSPESEPENLLISREALENLEEYLKENLSEAESRVLALYIEGRTYEEISGMLGISRKACDNAIQRVRKKLKHRS